MSWTDWNSGALLYGLVVGLLMGWLFVIGGIAGALAFRRRRKSGRPGGAAGPPPDVMNR